MLACIGVLACAISRSLTRRMRIRMDLLKLTYRHLRINLRRAHFDVTDIAE